MDDISFQVGPGEIFGILGANGAGKTTTVEMLTGLRRPDAGRIRVLGLDPRADRAGFTAQVGAQLQSSGLPAKMRVGEAIELYQSFHADPIDGAELLDELGLAHARGTAYDKLSGGQQQRLAIALALVGRPRVAVLDELTTGLDPQARRDTWELIAGIRRRGATVILVTHFMEEAEYLCDRVMIIAHGHIIATGSPSAVTQQTRGSTSVRFRPDRAFPDALLTDLPQVTSLKHTDGEISLTGNAEAVQAVLAALSRADIHAGDLRVRQANLEDAFIALTNASETGDGHLTTAPGCTAPDTEPPPEPRYTDEHRHDPGRRRRPSHDDHAAHRVPPLRSRTGRHGVGFARTDHGVPGPRAHPRPAPPARRLRRRKLPARVPTGHHPLSR